MNPANRLQGLVASRRIQALFVLVVLAALVITLPRLSGLIPTAKAASSTVVISEFRVRGPSGGNDEFIELYNVTDSPINIGGWKINGSNSAGTVSTRVTIAAGTMIPARGHFLATNSAASGYSGSVAGNQTYTTGFTDDGGVALLNASNTIIDQVGLSTGSAYKEGTPLTSLGSTNANRGYERKPGGTSGSTQDTDGNSADFALITPSDPQNLSSAPTPSVSPTPTPSPTPPPSPTPTPTTNPTGVGSATPSSVAPGGNSTLKVTVTPGTNPASTGLAVTADLSSIGGSANQALFDDGSNGDATPGDNIFSYQVTVPLATTPGAKIFQATITDAQSRSSNTNIGLTVSGAGAAKGAVVISQIYGAGGNAGAVLQNDYIEIFNRSNAPVDITGWSVQYTSASGPSGPSWSGKTTLSGVLAPGQYYLIVEGGGANGSPLPVTADVNGTILMGATDGKVALVANDNALTGSCPVSDPGVIDLVGYGSANCSEGGSAAPSPSTTAAIFRARSGCKDTDINQANFTQGSPNPRNTSTTTNVCPAGDDAPEVFNSTPVNGSSQADPAGNITVNFDEPVNVTGTWYQISCSTSGSHPATFSGGPTTFTINPDTDFAANEECTVTVLAAQVNDIDTDDPPDNMVANYVFSFTTSLTRDPNEHLVMGNPSNATADVNFPLNYLMPKPQYVLSYNRDKGTPNWVSWHLDQSWTQGTGQRQDDYRNDPSLPAGWYQVQGDDYMGSGFDRGHMTPSADRLSTNEDNSATFFMTNMVPQSPDNNQGPWNDFEQFTRTLLNGTANEIYVVSGPYGQGGEGSNGPLQTTAGGHAVVPQSTWKVVMILPTGNNDASRVTNSTRTIALIMPNVQGIRTVDWRKYIATVDQVEALTGYDFFSNVDPAVQSVIESTLDSESNTAPVSSGQSVSTPEETSLNITLSATDFNINNVLTYTITDAPDHGTLTGSGANLTYIPNPNYNGPDSFKFKANDGAVDSNESTVNITVTAVNDPPGLSGVPANVTIPENAPYSFTATANDTDLPAQTLTFSLVSGPTGSSINPSTGVFTWTPTEAQGGTGSPFNFTVRVSDGTANTDAPISISVAEVNQTPSLGPISNQSVNIGDPINLTAQGSDSDLPAQTLIYSLTGTVPSGASINSATGAFTWTPNGSQTGLHTITVRVTDNGASPLFTETSFQVQVNAGATYSISGQITGACGSCDGLTVTLGGSQSSTATTSGGGNYSFTSLLGNGNYTVTPSGGGYTYSPLSRTYGSLAANQTANFVASNPTPAQPRDVLISEFRLSGPAGSNDEFIELYNKTDNPILINATDASAGWSIAASDGVLRAIIPNGTVIPARGHYLAVNNTPGSGYSLDVPEDVAYLLGISDNAGIALFTTSNPLNYNLATRADAVGSSNETNILYRSGTGYSPLTTVNLEGAFYRDLRSGVPANTGNNAADFLYVNTTGTAAGAGQRLGAPGPESLGSPINRNSYIPASLVDPNAPAAGGVNRVRDTSDTGPGKTFGTIIVRRHFTNLTGSSITQLRFRAVIMTTFPQPNPANADVRALSSTGPISVTLSGGGTATIEGTTLEAPSDPDAGGGLNSTLVVNLGSPLPNGASINVQWVLGVVQKGNFQYYVNVEAGNGPIAPPPPLP